jgi:hypothetical protein
MYRLTCRNCGQDIDADDVPELAGVYLLHCVRGHWDDMVTMHEASIVEIAEAIVIAKSQGWL